MVTILHSIFLGFVQGLSEFLPISSSGHLIAIPYIFSWNYQGLAFDIALHAGTAIAIVAFFWRDWVNILKNAFIKKKNGKENQKSGRYPDNLLWQILVASIPAAIIGLVLEEVVDNALRSVIFVAFNLAFFGFLLWYADKKSKSHIVPQEITYGKSFLIGISQSFALIPGVSRSGITLTAGRWLGLAREDAARFSFLLATPAIVGAFLLKLPEIGGNMTSLAFWLGVISSTVFGILAIKFLMNYLKKSDLKLFFWYRIAVALILVAVYLIKG